MKKYLLVFVAVAVALMVGAGGAVALSPAMAILQSTAAVSCGTTATQIALPVATPARSICVQNLAAVDVYVGGPTVTTSTGFLLPAGSTSAPTQFCFDAQTGYCVVASSTSPLRVLAGTGYSGR